MWKGYLYIWVIASYDHPTPLGRYYLKANIGIFDKRVVIPTFTYTVVRSSISQQQSPVYQTFPENVRTISVMQSEHDRSVGYDVITSSAFSCLNVPAEFWVLIGWYFGCQITSCKRRSAYSAVNVFKIFLHDNYCRDMGVRFPLIASCILVVSWLN